MAASRSPSLSSVMMGVADPALAHAARDVVVASTRNSNSAHAARECAAQLSGLTPTLLLVFCGGKHDPHAIREVLASAFLDVAIVGGSGAGTISAAGCGYSGLELTVAAFTDPNLTPSLIPAVDLLAGDERAGAELGARIAAAATDGAVVLLLYDNVLSGDPVRLHSASRILDGVQGGLGARRVSIIGGGFLTDMNLSDGWVFTGSGVARHAALALVFPPNVHATTVVLHGCRPVSTFMEITRIDGAEVFELDGQSALSVIERMLDLPLGGSGGHDLTLLATLGEKQGDPFLPYDENAYVNRLIVTSNRIRGSVTLFEPDFRIGTKVQIMARDNSLMLQSVRDGVVAVGEPPIGRTGMLNLYIDCAGRASARSGAESEEADLVVRGLDPAIPLIGFYSGVEIAPFDGYSRPLDWTGVLTSLSRAL